MKLHQNKEAAKTKKDKEKKERTNKLANLFGDGTSSSIYGATFSMCLCLIAGGVVVIPFALREAGFGLGILLIIAVAPATVYTLHLQIHAAKLSDCHTYTGIMYAAFGKPGYIYVAILQFLYPFVGLISLIILIADQLSRLLIGVTGIDDLDDLQSRFWGTRAFITAVYLLLILPLALYKNIANLSKWGMISLLSVVLILVFFSIRLATLNLPATPTAYKFGDIEFVQGIGIISTLYVCHDSSLLIYNSMESPTEKRWDEVVGGSVAVALIFDLAIGIIGYVTFTGNSLGDVLENYCNHDDLINVGRLFFAISVMICVPICVFVARSVIEDTLFADKKPVPLCRHVLVSLLLIGAAYSITLATDCVGFVMELNGILIAIPLAFILPPALVIKLEAGPTWSRKTAPMWTTLFVGIFLVVAGLVVTVKELIDDGLECDKPSEAAFC